jgi:nitrous oxidase accessory protein
MPGLALLTLLQLGATIVVSPAGPVRSIEEAVRLAPSGGHIVIRAGTYDVGPIVLDRRVSIEGEGHPVLRGRGDHTILRVTADSVTIRGLVLERVASSYVEDRAALRFEGVRGCVAEDLDVRDSFFGIYLAKSAGCVVRGNRIVGGGRPEREAGNGIHLWDSRDVELRDNVISGHRDGLYFEFVRAAIVTGNTSTGNARYGLHFMFSDSCTYRGNAFLKNGAGVAVMYTKRLTIEQNRFEDNTGPAAYGLLLKEITDSRLEGNRFLRNSVGLVTEGGGRLEVRGNTFEDNGWAIRLMANSMDNRFEGNAFAGNSFDVATNSQSNYSVFASNWWDRYHGYDLDRNGFGDAGYRPVRLFSLLVTRYEPAIVLQRSAFVDLLDQAERVLPLLTPETLVDATPLMARPR